ncbi:MAG: TIGR02710 family CRISPR-associated CARF protein, partial [Armatimonadota bacterium]|nr:TIGR02710 family CRISPR-associated CARF protein [Armatimonadota bacterium]MDW8156986.1 TIGR02710 family CRISPR-associated CARF protein [Armatimonadota bacterium]
FNTGHFATVLQHVSRVRERTVRDEHRRRLDFLTELSQACQAWELLDYRRACEHFRACLRQYPDLTEALAPSDEVPRACEVVHRLWKSRCTGPPCGCGLPLDALTSVDLLAHADRRAAGHLYDVAVLLLYRLLEYLAQHRLHDRDFRADRVDLDRLPDAVRGQWVKRTDSDGSLRLGMVEAFQLLADLGDPLGTRFMDLYGATDSKLRAYLQSRNLSPLAHGFQPVGPEVYDKLRALVTEQFLAESVPQWEHHLGQFRLPLLDPCP